MDAVQERDWDLRDTFIVGAYFKIDEKSGKIWTARITKVEPDRVHFIDRDEQPVGLHRDDIKKYRRIRGDVDGN